MAQGKNAKVLRISIPTLAALIALAGLGLTIRKAAKDEIDDRAKAQVAPVMVEMSGLCRRIDVNERKIEDNEDTLIEQGKGIVRLEKGQDDIKELLLEIRRDQKNGGP